MRSKMLCRCSTSSQKPRSRKNRRRCSRSNKRQARTSHSGQTCRFQRFSTHHTISATVQARHLTHLTTKKVALAARRNVWTALRTVASKCSTTRSHIASTVRSTKASIMRLAARSPGAATSSKDTTPSRRRNYSRS